jgi:hypothetical protein
MNKAQKFYAKYIRCQKDGSLSEDMLECWGEITMPAIRLEKLNDSKWFAELLRNAASNSQRPTNGAGVLQEYTERAPEWRAYYNSQSDPKAGNVVPSGECPLAHCCSGSGEPPRKMQRQGADINEASDEGKDEKLTNNET